MPKTTLGRDVTTKKNSKQAPVQAAPNVDQSATAALTPDAGNLQLPPAWAHLRIAIIDDAMHPPQLGRLNEDEVAAITSLLMTDEEVAAELRDRGCSDTTSADDRLRIIAETDTPLVSLARVGEVSPDAVRMIEEYQAFRRLQRRLEQEVAEVKICDPFQTLPSLEAYNLVLLDYYLEGNVNGGDRAISVANSISEQPDRLKDQQIVLMSSIEGVRDLRGEFRVRAGLSGSAFAFVGKPDLNEAWKIKAHLGMLARAQPYGPAFKQYRETLDQALEKARKELLMLVDDLDIGDYAFLQGRALMNDGHPLGDYVFWLLSSQLTALAFESDDMRERQRALDKLEFVGEPFAATEPSTVVANMLHSALVSRNVGALAAHPRADPNGKFVSFPLVQLGDVFFDATRTKAVVVVSADCDLAFSPSGDREPDSQTPVMLVPGSPIRLKDATGEPNPRTDGILHREEVYRIVWDFAKYRSVELGKLEQWLKSGGFDVTNRDRLRPLFGLKLQQEFGAHLLRVGPPLMPPLTTAAIGRVFVCKPEREEMRQFSAKELMLTRFKGTTLLRVTPNVAGALKAACDSLHDFLYEQHIAAQGKNKEELAKRLTSLSAQVENDDFWIDLLKGVPLNVAGSMKSLGPLGFILGQNWQDSSRSRVVLEIQEDIPGPVDNNSIPVDVSTTVESELGGDVVSGAA